MTKKLQVFVSSTYTDLKQERQAAVAAILKSGHIPAGMELFTAGDQSQWDTIKAWIDESDVYMLILGGRYGSVESASNLAYTELEYDYAVAQGKPFFAVVIREAALEKKVKDHGTAVVELENGTALQKFRAKVLSNISSFFDDEKDIRLSVYETLADFAANKNLIGWVPGNAVVDTLPLYNEIKSLTNDKALLEARISEFERRLAKSAGKVSDFDSLFKILMSEKIALTRSAFGDGEGKEQSLMTLFYANQSGFVTGISNDMSMTDLESFLFYRLGPKLQIHGLVQYEKVPSARFRLCSITSKGSEFLGELARRKYEKLNSKASSVEQKDEPQNSLPVAKEVEKKPTRSKKTTT
jgi:hypothetical protein